MDEKKVSIIIPMYNVENYLEDCLKSVINQTFQNLEIICVDDGSSDKTLLIANSIAKTDNRISIIRNSINRGPSYTRNKGMGVASGKYLYFLDSDDMITENAIEELWNEAEEKKLDVVFFDAKIVFENENLKEKFKGNSMQHFGQYRPVMSGAEAFNTMMQNGEWTINLPREFWKSKFLRDNGIQFENDILHEDELFSTLAIMKVKRCSVVKEQYFIRRFRNNSIMTSKKSPKNMNGHFRCLSELIKYLSCHTYETSDYTEMDTYLKKFKKHITNALLGHDDWEIDTKDQFEYAVKKMLDIDLYQIFSKHDIAELHASDRIVIYGAGKVARRIFGELLRFDLYANEFVVTDRTDNVSSLFGLPVEEIAQCSNIYSSTVIIGIQNKEQVREVKKLLNQYCIDKVIVPRL